MDFSDFNFLQYTEFYNKDAFHPRMDHAYAETFNNFDGWTHRASIEIITMGAATPAITEEQVVHSFVNRILAHNQSL